MRADLKSSSEKRVVPAALVGVAVILAVGLSAAAHRGSGGGSPSTGEKEPVTGESEILAALAYPAEEPNRQLRVVKTSLPMPDPMEYLRSPETLEYPGNFVFVVVESESRNVQGGQVVGLVYATENRSMVPRQYWGAGLAWIEERQAPYLVVVKALSWHATLSVYEIDSARRIGDHPLVFDPSRFDEWPKADEPIAVTERTLAGTGPCGVSSVDVYSEDGQIRIDASRTRAECPTSTIGFDIEKKEWTEIE